MQIEDPSRLDVVDRVTAAIGDELRRLEPTTSVAWPELPDVRAMAAHIGFVHRWVSAVLATGGPVDDDAVDAEPGPDLAGWYDEGRATLLTLLERTDPAMPCWVIGVDPTAAAGFWTRRMVFENTKHLMDLRAAGGADWRPAAELAPADYADGVDELLEVFLPRSRARLAHLPAGIALEATDTGDEWLIGADWSTGPRIAPTARVRAPAAYLALAVWDRADPLRDVEHYRAEGDLNTVAAFTATAIHPW